MTNPVSPIAAWESLFRAQVAVMRQIASEFPSDVISLNEYDVLFTLTLSENRTLRIRELSESVLLTQPSISRLVDRLAARGLVSKLTDPTDGRGTLVALTEDGFSLFRDAARIHGRSISGRMTAALEPDELTELARLTRKLYDSVTSS
ncbi:MarR family winged helix-turn-helix transcriptional regulator [Agreia sp. COWG]|uniref:MarR family winged helix-turn-helix transcriptional regulator n=1 Tax=Agreia sp. COWG TaxID=2773266 RepID=UPI001927153A|nr:MarR family transcriptional regulator [Agreia sp. COWG]CAD5990483.1 Transcriptional regulator [Agreia sp. COWG]